MASKRETFHRGQQKGGSDNSSLKSGGDGKAKAAKRPKSGVSTRERDFRCGEVYHVYQRGNDGKKTFHDQMARFLYLERLFFLCKRHEVKVHNFCLMHNHVHFVLQQERVDGISNLMQELQPYHARFHNQRLNKTGNLWQQHFGCKHVDTNEYYQTLMVYVENNPRICRRASNIVEYKWSGASAHVRNGQVEITVEGRTLTTELYLDGWRKRCAAAIEAGWVQVLFRRTMETEALEKIEAMLDGKKRQAMAQKERAKRRAAQKPEAVRQAGQDSLSTNPGEGEISEVGMAATDVASGAISETQPKKARTGQGRSKAKRVGKACRQEGAQEEKKERFGGAG